MMTFTNLGFNLFNSQFMEAWSNSARVENESKESYKPLEIMNV